MFCETSLFLVSFVAFVAPDLSHFYQNQYYLGHVSSEMFCEGLFAFVCFAALVALERLFPTVRPHVALQITRRRASVVALVTLVWLYSCVLAHHVNIQLVSCNAGKLAHCASVRFFPRVSPFVILQMV